MGVSVAHGSATFEQAMAASNAEVIAAFNRGDAKACAGFYLDDATLLLPDRPPIKGRPAIEAVLEEYIAAGAKLASVDPAGVGADGDLGYCTGAYRFNMPARDGSASQETGKFVTVFRRRADGSWRVAVDALVRDSTAGPR